MLDKKLLVLPEAVADDEAEVEKWSFCLRKDNDDVDDDDDDERSDDEDGNKSDEQCAFKLNKLLNILWQSFDRNDGNCVDDDDDETSAAAVVEDDAEAASIFIKLGITFRVLGHELVKQS